RSDRLDRLEDGLSRSGRLCGACLLAPLLLEVGHDHRLGVDADELSVRPHESLVEDAAGKVAEVVPLQSVEIAQVDLRRFGDLPERDLTQLPLAPQGLYEGRHLTVLAAN